mgnify:CR=1 FL=1
MAASTSGVSFRRDIAILIFVTLFTTYAYFWQSRCWNSATRLMLTYAIGDRATIFIDGFEELVKRIAQKQKAYQPE